jgi:hypothetical protein
MFPLFRVVSVGSRRLGSCRLVSSAARPKFQASQASSLTAFIWGSVFLVSASIARPSIHLDTEVLPDALNVQSVSFEPIDGLAR